MPGLFSKAAAARWQDAALFDGFDADALAVVESIAAYVFFLLGVSLPQ